MRFGIAVALIFGLVVGFAFGKRVAYSEAQRQREHDNWVTSVCIHSEPGAIMVRAPYGTLYCVPNGWTLTNDP